MLKFNKKEVDGNFGIVRFANRKCIAYCKPIAKYDVLNNKWKKADKTNKQKALSVVKYNTKFGIKRKESNTNFDYFIVMNGMRAENYSKCGNGTGWGMNNFLQEIDKIDAKLKVVSILVDNDAPLEEQGKLLARYINKIKINEKCEKIHILGISKCGTIIVSMLKYLTDVNLDKLNLIAYMAPYRGTIFASPTLFYKKIDEKLEII